MTNAQKTMTTSAWLLLFLLGFVWGGSFVFAKIAVAEIPPLTLVLLRVSLAALTLHVICAFAGVRLTMTFQGLRNYAVMGLLNNVIAFSLIFWGQQEIGASLSSILNAATPFFTVLIAGLVLADERFSANKLAGLVVGFFGVVMVIGPRHLLGLGDNLVSELAIVGAALSYGFASVWGRRFAGEPPLATATGQLTMSTLMMIPIAFIVERPLSMSMPSLQVVFAVLALSVVCTALAYLLFFKILKMAGATNVSLVTMLVPISAIILSIPLLGEELDALKLIGLGVIGIGLAVLDGRPLRTIRARFS
ncbi:MAG: DMT family transporter [Pseudomonadota bacterium]